MVNSMRSAICLNYGHSRITLHCGFSHGLKLSFMARLHLGFISITRYRDIDRGVGDLVTIAAPRHRTISPTKASLASALLNSSHRTHSVIIITRTVTGHHLKGPDRRPVGDRAPPRDRAVQHTQ